MAATHSTIGRIPNLVLVTDRHATAGRNLVDVVTRALGAGLPAVHLRDKDLPGREIHAIAERLRAATRSAGALLYVNDRVDVAVAVEADGVHVGGASLPVDVARALLPAGMQIGQSTHGLDEVRVSTADFLFFGPVHDTPSKRAFGAPQGMAQLRQAVAAARAPVIAIGGLDVGRAAAARNAGAHGIAVVRAILAAGDPAAATRDLLAALR
ncbi:MAG TPA: thiamine phosphate synthase [Candidatus Eisenbacteria bacterium]|nr:thiamine phosphate synthase [Candidatus Eisenbacteria bacterium]